MPIEAVRHSERQCYIQEGHGGREIEVWPIYRFFQEYVNGSRERARAHFQEWYFKQYMKYGNVPKRLGGMCGGSLARTLARTKQGDSDDGPYRYWNNDDREPDENDALREAIAERVEQRFELLESISNRGYHPDREDPVIGIERGPGIYLEGGHHRAAALKALGWATVPAVLVFSTRATHRLWRWQCALHHAAVSRGLAGRLPNILDRR